MLYNITADVAASEHDGEHIIDALEGYHPAVMHAGNRATIIMTLPAEDTRQAVRTALAVLQSNVDRELLSLEVMTTEDFDRREGFDVVPELVAVSEAAEILGTSRQAVQQQIDRGRFLTARKVGPTWVIARAEVEKRRAR